MKTQIEVIYNTDIDESFDRTIESVVSQICDFYTDKPVFLVKKEFDNIDRAIIFNIEDEISTDDQELLKETIEIEIQNVQVYVHTVKTTEIE